MGRTISWRSSISTIGGVKPALSLPQGHLIAEELANGQNKPGSLQDFEKGRLSAVLVCSFYASFFFKGEP
jgi:hypothetical protein